MIGEAGGLRAVGAPRGWSRASPCATAAWWAAKGATFHWSAAGSWQTLSGGVAANAAFAAIGVGVGALIRNLVAAVAAALAWIAVVEGILGQLIGLGPGPLAAVLRQRVPGPGQPDLRRRVAAQWGGGLMLLAYALAFAAAAVLITLKRDVT